MAAKRKIQVIQADLAELKKSFTGREATPAESKELTALEEELAEANPTPADRIAKNVRVRVASPHPIGEGGHRVPGEVFEVDEKRRPALGKLVEDAPDAPIGKPVVKENKSLLA